MTSRELRNARVFKSAQAHYDNMNPPEFDRDECEYDEDEDWVPELRTKAPPYIAMIDRHDWMLGYEHPEDEPEDWCSDRNGPSVRAFLAGRTQRKEDETP